MKITNSQYWRYQILGWSFASLYWAYIAYFKQDYSIFYTSIDVSSRQSVRFKNRNSL